MQIKKEYEGEALCVALVGRLDANTAAALEGALGEEPGTLKTVRFDMAGLAYISSAGLRVLLAQHKKCAANGGGIALSNCGNAVKDVLEITGFCDVVPVG